MVVTFHIIFRFPWCFLFVAMFPTLKNTMVFLDFAPPLEVVEVSQVSELADELREAAWYQTAT